MINMFFTIVVIRFLFYIPTIDARYCPRKGDGYECIEVMLVFTLHCCFTHREQKATQSDNII